MTGLARSRALRSTGALALAGALVACGGSESMTAVAAATGTTPADTSRGGSGAGTTPFASLADDPRTPGTRRMAERLARLAGEADPALNPCLNRARAARLEAHLEQVADPAWRLELTVRLAEEHVFAGETRRALETIDGVARAAGPDARPGLAKAVRDLRALAWLRIGEQDNCIAHHGVDSCLAPVRGDGIYSDPRGPRRAIELLNETLRDDPEDFGARWLLNLACMTIGEWPDRVPERFLIPPSAFASEHEIGRLFDVAPRAGLAVRGRAGGAILEDFDGDGRLDVMTSSWGPSDPLRLFRSAGDGRFEERTRAAGLIGLDGGLNLVQADFDNDGWPDVLVPRGAWWQRGGHYPKSLLRNLGDGRFDDVTEAAGLLTFHPSQVTAFADFDGDGLLDLFAGNESMAEDPHPSELWQNRGDGTFHDATPSLGATDLGYVKGAAWGDFDDDGDPDLYVSVLDGENRLFRNDGPAADGGWRFSEIAREAGVTEPRSSFVTWWWDHDGDGRLDLFVGGYALMTCDVGQVARMYLGLAHRCEPPRLYRNRGDGRFDDVTRETGLDRVSLIMAANHGDLDNDGWPDAYFGTGAPDLRALVPNRMFRNDGGRRFQDVTTAGGFGHLQKGHGIAFGDVDGDGDQDVFEVMGGAYEGDVSQNVLYENPGHGNHWITLRLAGARANRSAIGARIRARVREDGRWRDIHALAGTGGSFGANSLQQEIGLGRAALVDELEIRWPGSGTVDRHRDVAADGVYLAREGAGALVRIEARPFRLPGPGPAPPPPAPARAGRLDPPAPAPEP